MEGFRRLLDGTNEHESSPGCESMDICIYVCVCVCLFSLFVKQSSGTGIVKNQIPKLCKS